MPTASFDFPKSIYNTYDCLAPIISDRKAAIVLDYFAGSGTTGHAVMILNKEDTGNRQFILCTNDENEIASKVCYPRIGKVIKGHKDYPEITKISANLKYFRTDFVDAESTDANKKKLVDKSTEMLFLKEDCFTAIKACPAFKIFTNGQGKLLGIVYEDDGINSFKKEVVGHFEIESHHFILGSTFRSISLPSIPEPGHSVLVFLFVCVDSFF